MVEKILPIAKLMEMNAGIEEVGAKPFTGNLFQDIFNKAVEGLNQVSASEMKADALTEGYLEGRVDIDDVLIAAAASNMLIQLAVTTLTSAVNTFKEITQMPV